MWTWINLSAKKKKIWNWERTARKGKRMRQRKKKLKLLKCQRKRMDWKWRNNVFDPCAVCSSARHRVVPGRVHVYLGWEQRLALTGSLVASQEDASAATPHHELWLLTCVIEFFLLINVLLFKAPCFIFGHLFFYAFCHSRSSTLWGCARKRLLNNKN